MRVTVGSGRYVIGVSGGVDSMVLLDLLRQRPGVQLIVAHFDHGIRPESAQDRQLVAQYAKRYQLPFVYDQGRLGLEASEATARAARYTFLRKVAKATDAKAIITAHHQDDMLETAFINLMRGTGRRGLTSLRSTDGIIRPLLPYTKRQIREYAHNHAIPWNEDSSNTDTRYLRNHLRLNVMPRLTDGQRAQLLILIDQLTDINDELDAHLVNMLHVQPSHNELDRQWFIHLPHAIAKEIIHAWFRRHGVKNMQKRTIERLLVAMKTAHSGSTFHVDKHHDLHVGRKRLALQYVER